MWENRCYSDGIPDEVPAKLAASGRAPSWKSIAVAILKNDLRSIGIYPEEGRIVHDLRRIQRCKESGQQEIF